MVSRSVKVPPITLEQNLRYDVLDNTYITKVALWRTEIGDLARSDSFIPQIKMLPWDDEAHFSVQLIHTELSATMESDREKIIWKGTNLEAHFFDVNGFDEGIGSFEFEIVLPHKPSTNLINFSIQSQGLRFLFQPPLTAGEIADGHERPDSVVGSYAVYYTKKGDFTRSGGQNYKAGKVCHIFRPTAFDSSPVPNEVVCDLNITGNTMTITVSQTFLDNAIYPVHVDPTFGYEVIGGSLTTMENVLRGNVDAPATSGTLTMLTAYIRSTTIDQEVSGGLYEGNITGALIQTGDEVIATGDNVARWVDLPFTVQPDIVGGVGVAIIAFGDSGAGSFVISYDAGDPSDVSIAEASAYPAFPDPLAAVDEDRLHSIFATYDEPPPPDGVNLPEYGQLRTAIGEPPVYGATILRS